MSIERVLATRAVGRRAVNSVLAIDAGRTTCRAGVVIEGVVAAETATPASGTMVDPAGVRIVHDAILKAVDRLGDAAAGCE